jgi:hypothetical protein
MPPDEIIWVVAPAAPVPSTSAASGAQACYKRPLPPQSSKSHGGTDASRTRGDSPLSRASHANADSSGACWRQKLRIV